MWYGVAYEQKKWYGKCHTSHTASATLADLDRLCTETLCSSALSVLVAATHNEGFI